MRVIKYWKQSILRCDHEVYSNRRNVRFFSSKKQTDICVPYISKPIKVRNLVVFVLATMSFKFNCPDFQMIKPYSNTIWVAVRCKTPTKIAVFMYFMFIGCFQQFPTHFIFTAFHGNKVIFGQNRMSPMALTPHLRSSSN